MKRVSTADAVATRQLTARQVELVNLMAVDGSGTRARFTSSERITDWAALKKVMELLGGKWVRSQQAFQFDPDLPLDAMLREAVETREVPDPRAAGFFETPRALAERLVETVDIQHGDVVLEPSAGRGAIADVVRERHPHAELVLCELLERNRQVLLAKGYSACQQCCCGVGYDFLHPCGGMVNGVPPHAVVMNPPFAKGTDVEHVTKAFGLLRRGGRLAAIMSAGTSFRTDRRTATFRALVQDVGGSIEPLPPGSFKVSGTMVHTVFVTMRRAQ